MLAISHYRILQSLGAGGMGEVYLAEDTILGRRVALKLLPEKHTHDQERLRRFKQEAKSASALNHPNIVTIHEVGESDGHHFIATEFIDGETLRALLKRTGKIEIKDSLNIATQVVSALAAAHEAGIVHRDIKPENIMVRRDGYVKVLDFGLAKLTEPEASQTVDTNLQTISAVHTETGIVLGTAHYMSPEQATGKNVDGRTDIFSFGAVLYEMISGQRAFQGNSVVEILAATLNQEPKALPPKVPPELAMVILRCLRKDPARRFQTMADLKLALEDAREQIQEPRKRLSSRKFVPVILMIAALFAFLLWQPWKKETAVGPLRVQAITTLPGVEQYPSLSPDGKQVVFAWTGSKQDNQDIYVQMIGQGSPLRLTTDLRYDYNPVWSPDGRWIAFLRSEPSATTGARNRELRLIAPLGGPERKLSDITSQDFDRNSTYLAWTPESKAVIVTDSQGEGRPDALFVISIETGEKKRLTNPQSPVLADTSPAVSPDGRSLVFLRRISWSSGELQLLALGKDMRSSGEPRRLTHAEQRANDPAWMPDGEEIIFAAKGNLWRLPISGEKSATQIPFVGEDGMMPTISRTESGKPPRLVYVRRFSDTNIWRVETSTLGAPSTSAPVAAISSTKEEFHCQFSPDGNHVAFISFRSGEAEIWISDPDGSNAVQLTSLGIPDTTWPHWSPDGQMIAFSSALEGEWDIYVIPAAGGKPRRLTSHPSIDIQPVFSHDGKWIYFASMRSGDFRIWKMPANGGDAIQVTPNQGRGAMESADGKNLYYHAVSVVAPLFRLPTTGGRPIKVLDGIIWYNYCLVKNGIYYIDQQESETRLQFLDLASGNSTTIAQNLGKAATGLTASPDGKTILFARVDSSIDDLMLVENFE
ncbi:serine/threonine-protein kinase [bacterium]|nr:serine/threonine-protein kinase [bacterium]